MFDGYGYGMGSGGWILMALFWIALVALVVWAIVRLAPGRSEPSGQAREQVEKPRERVEEPREILDRRLASGEIDVETYEELKEKLREPTLAEKA